MAINYDRETLFAAAFLSDLRSFILLCSFRKEIHILPKSEVAVDEILFFGVLTPVSLSALWDPCTSIAFQAEK